MASMLCLPNELLRLVIQNTGLEEIESLSLSCSLIHQLISPELTQNRKLKRKYSHICITDTDRSSTLLKQKSVHPLQVLRDICADPQIACYPRSLNIEERKDHLSATEEFFKQHHEATSYLGMENRLVQMIQQCPYIGAEIAGDWVEAIKSCNFDACAALLLTLLPNLQSLILGERRDLTIVFDMIRDISAAHGVITRSSLLKQPVALSQISEVRLKGSTVGNIGQMCCFEALCALPQLESIHAEALAGLGYSWDTMDGWPTIYQKPKRSRSETVVSLPREQ